MHNPGHIADTIINLGKRRHRLAEISELNPAERYRQIRGPDQIDTGHLVVMSQQFGDTGPTRLSAATGYNNHDAHKRSPKIVATKF
jgi:hypothetical protein